MTQKSEKMMKSELRAPDAFQRAGGEARVWLEERRKAVAIALAVLLLGGAGVAVAGYVSDRGEARASKALGDALKVLGRPVEGEAESAGLPPSGPAFKTVRERDEALQKALADFRSAHPGTRAAATAALPLAKAEYRLGNYDAAARNFEAFLASAPKSDALRPQGLEGLGYTHEAKGDFAKALEAFEQLSKENQTEFLAGMGQYHRARMLALQNKAEDAAQAFAEVQTAHPNTAAARLSSERLAVLTSQGVKVPSPAPAATPDAG